MPVMIFSTEIADKILERLANGESLRAICRDKGMPAPSTVCTWVKENKEFAEQYAHARELQSDILFDEIEEIAREAVANGEAADTNARRLLIDAHKWRLSKMLPKKYGDKLDLDIKKSDPLDDMTAEDLVKLRASVEKRIEGDTGQD